MQERKRQIKGQKEGKKPKMTTALLIDGQFPENQVFWVFHPRWSSFTNPDKKMTRTDNEHTHHGKLSVNIILPVITYKALKTPRTRQARPITHNITDTVHQICYKKHQKSSNLGVKESLCKAFVRILEHLVGSRMDYHSRELAIAKQFAVQWCCILSPQWHSVLYGKTETAKGQGCPICR